MRSETPTVSNGMFKSAVKKVDRERLVRRTLVILNSPQFVQLGYSRYDTQRIKELVRSTDISFFFYVFELVVRALASNPTSVMFEDVERAVSSMGLFVDSYERQLLANISSRVFNVGPASVIYIWLTFAAQLYKIVDLCDNLKLIYEKRLEPWANNFALERKILEQLITSVVISDSVSSVINNLQNIFLLSHSSSKLSSQELLAVIKSFLDYGHRPMSTEVLNFALLSSVAISKTSPSPLSVDKNLNVEFNELVEFLIRISLIQTMQPVQSIKSDVQQLSPNLYSSCADWKIENLWCETADTFIHNVHRLDKYLEPRYKEIGLEGLDEDVFIVNDDELLG